MLKNKRTIIGLVVLFLVLVGVAVVFSECLELRFPKFSEGHFNKYKSERGFDDSERCPKKSIEIKSVEEKLPEIKDSTGAVVSLVENEFQGVSMISARSEEKMTHAEAATYCWNLNAPAELSRDGDTTTAYKGWKLPTMAEGAIFEGMIQDVEEVWTAGIRDSYSTTGTWIHLNLADGNWTYDYYGGEYFVRCVR